MSLQILIFHFKLQYNAFCDYAGYIISSDIEQKKKIIEHWVANCTTHIYSDNFLARDLLHRTPGEEVPYPIIKGGLCRWFSHYMLEHSCSSSKGLDRNNLCLTYIFLFSFFVYETKKLHLNKCLPYKVVHTFLKIHSLHLGFTLQYILTIQKKMYTVHSYSLLCTWTKYYFFMLQHYISAVARHRGSASERSPFKSLSSSFSPSPSPSFHLFTSFATLLFLAQM